MNETAMALGIGTLLGIVLFFVLAHFGYIEKLLASIDSMMEKKS
jgi:hypothetical protein